MAESAPLKRGLNTYQGGVTHRAVAEAFGMDWREV